MNLIIVNKNYFKVRNHCDYTRKYRSTPRFICNLRHKNGSKVPVVFHNGSKYDYHVLLKGLIEEFEEQFDCLGENTYRYITNSLQIKKNLKIIKYSHIFTKKVLIAINL